MDKHNTELTDSQLDAMLVRIQKLMALTTSPSEGEATAAAEMVQKLLFKYNLTMAQVDTAKQANGQRDIRTKYQNNTVSLGVERGQVANWRRDLMYQIARHNFCRSLQWAGQPRMQLIGQPHNVEAVIQMFDYLTAAIDRLSAEGWEQAKAENGGKAPLVFVRTKKTYGYFPQHAKQYRSSFSHGAVSRVSARLREMRDALRTADAESMALVVVSDKELTEAVNSFYSSLSRKTVSRPGIDSAAYAAGQAAGNKISLDKQVAGGAAKALKS